MTFPEICSTVSHLWKVVSFLISNQGEMFGSRDVSSGGVFFREDFNFEIREDQLKNDRTRRNRSSFT